MSLARPPDPRVVARIAEVWRALSHAMLTPDVLRDMMAALQRRDLNGALAALPNLADPRDARSSEIKAGLMHVMSGSLKNAFKFSADREYKRVGSIIRVGKTLQLDYGHAEAMVWSTAKQNIDLAALLKAKEPALNRFAEVPHDDTFIFNRSADLVVDIGDEQRDNLRNTLAMRFDPDVRPENVIRDIKWVVGLTDRESSAVFRREEGMRAAGVPERRIQTAVARYSDELHQKRAERIARTETVAIETQARDTAWQVARSDGLIPDNAKKEWVASAMACKDLCKKLDGVKVKLDGHWLSPVDGRIIKGPPAHPHCECSTVLRVA